MTEPISPQRLADIREADGHFPLLPSAASVYGHRRELLAEVDRLTRQLDQARQHAERLQSWITPRHRYTLTLVGDELVLRCTDHDAEVAHWIEDRGPYRFHPIDDAAHAHEVWQHAEDGRDGKRATTPRETAQQPAADDGGE